jgi:hypothetical protein
VSALLLHVGAPMSPICVYVCMLKSPKVVCNPCNTQNNSRPCLEHAALYLGSCLNY